jgi:retron-type reverse transcriptase
MTDKSSTATRWIDHELLMKLVQRRVRDARVLRLIRRWLRAGVMLEGIVTNTVIGAPQGAVISPLLSNIYLHPLDLYWEQEVRDTKMVHAEAPSNAGATTRYRQ